MSNQNDIFDDLIKSQLEGFESSVSMADWDAIEAKLVAPKRKRIIAYWWMASIALFIAGVTTTMVMIGNKQELVQEPTEIALNSNDQAQNKESVVVKKYIPIPTEALSGKTGNEPNQPENLTQTTTNITNDNQTSVVKDETKTLPRSTTEVDKLPTNNVDIKLDETHNKGVADSSFSTDQKTVVSNETLDPVISAPKVALNDSGNKTTTPNETKFKPYSEIGVSFSPTWANKFINPNGANAWKINKDFNHIARTMETGSVSYQLEGRINRYVTERMYLGFGLTYNQIEEKTSYDYLVTEIPDEIVRKKELDYIPIDPRIGPIDVKYSGRNVYHYFEAPLRFGLTDKIPGTNIKVRFETGVRYMLLADMSGKKPDVTRIDSLVDLKSAISSYSRHNFGLTANAGVYWKVWNNTDFGVTPYYNYALTSIRKRDEGITEKPYNFGVNFSLHHKIRIK
ncbi:MAG: opacity protein-like surface antigen [Bacteroidia bacterium]